MARVPLSSVVNKKTILFLRFGLMPVLAYACSCTSAPRPTVPVVPERPSAYVEERRCFRGAEPASCDDPSITRIEQGDSIYNRTNTVWARHQRTPVDPDPTEPITPLEKSAEISILNDPPCDECEHFSCPTSGGCPSVKFESLAKVIPGLDPGEQPIQVNFDCGFLWFDLEPRVIAPHVAASRRFLCDCSRERLVCHLESYRGVFERNSHDAIRVSDTISVDEALEIASLFRARKLDEFPQGFLTENATLHGVYRNGQNYELFLDNCGENALVRLERSRRGSRLRFLKGVHGSACV